MNSPTSSFPFIMNNSEAKYTEGLDLSFITDRVIAMGCPYDPSSPDRMLGKEKNDINAVVRFLAQRFKPGTCRIWDLTTESTYDVRRFDVLRPFQGPSAPVVVVRRGFEDHHPSPMGLLWDILREIDEWLALDPQNVAVAHCMAGRGRTGLVIASYLLCSGVCGTAAEALAFFARQRGMNVKNGSQRRYVGYVEHQLLTYSHNNNNVWPVPRAAWVPPPEIPVHLCRVRLLSPPAHLLATSALEMVPLECARSPVKSLSSLVCGKPEPRSDSVVFDINTSFKGDLLFRVYGPKENDNPLTFKYQLAFRFVVNSYFVNELNGKYCCASASSSLMAAIPELHGAVLAPREFVVNIDRQDLDGGLVGGLYDTRYSDGFKVQIIAAPALTKTKL